MIEVKIKDLISEQISGEWGEEVSDEKGVFIIRTTNFQNDGYLNLNDVIIRDVPQSKVEAKKLIRGDVIIEKSGGSTDQPVGRVVFFDEEQDQVYLTNNFTTILRPNINMVYPPYFHYLLLRNYQLKKVLKFQNKTTGIINLKLDRYLNSKIKIHNNKLDQLKASILIKKIEDQFYHRKYSIELYKELLNSVFYELIGDSTSDENQGQIINLGDLIDEVCYGSNSKGFDAKSASTPVPVLRIPNVIDGKVNLSQLKYIEYKKSEFDKLKLLNGDLLFVRSNGNKNFIGRCACFQETEDKYAFASYLIRVRLKKSTPINPEVLADIVNSPSYRKLIVKQAKTTAGNYNINISRLKKLKLIVPDDSLQDKYLKIKSAYLKVQKLTERSKKLYEELKMSVLQKVFSDELDFNGIDIEHIHPNQRFGDFEFSNLTVFPSKKKLVNKQEIPIEHKSFVGLIQKLEESKDTISYLSSDDFDEPNVYNFLKELDQQVLNKKSIPCCSEFIKYRLIKDDLSKNFAFETLWQEIKSTPFINSPSYDDVRDWLFNEINNGNISQLFDGRTKKIRLKLIR